MWVRFVYDPDTPQMNFKPGDAVEVPDYVVRRWELIWELFKLLGDEMGEWKERSWRQDTKALPPMHRTYGDAESRYPVLLREVS